MKYVRMRNLKTGDEIVVLALAPVEHSDLALAFAAKGYEAVSAGFLKIDPTAERGIRTVGNSQSLGLEPAADDHLLISVLYGATLNAAMPATATAKPGDDAITS